ncbi:MAG: FtsX-like permease family protein [Candidatus Peregrinibacteria bacterium]
MYILDAFRFSIRLLSQKKLQYSLVFLGLIASSCSLFFFLSLSEGIKTSVMAQTFQGTDTIKVQAVPQKIHLFQKKLDEELLQKIETIPGVAKVSREYPVVVPATAQASIIPFPIDFFFLKGIDASFFEKNIPAGKQFLDDPNSPLPIFLSPFALDFLNSFSESIPGFSGFDPQSVVGKTGEVTFGKSSFFPLISKKKTITRKIEVVGLSPDAPLLGMAIPLSTAININHELEGIETTPLEYSRLFVHLVDPSNRFAVQEKLKEMGLLVVSNPEKSDELSFSLLVLQGILLFSSSLLLILSALFLFSTLSLSVLEHQKTIGILRSLGTSKRSIALIFLSQGLLLSLSALIVGITFGYLASWKVNTMVMNALPHLSFLPDSLFLFSWSIPLFLFAIMGGITFLSTFFPARRAANMNPLEAILG